MLRTVLDFLEAILLTPTKLPLRKQFHKYDTVKEYEALPAKTGTPHVKTNATHGLSDEPFIYFFYSLMSFVYRPKSCPTAMHYRKFTPQQLHTMPAILSCNVE